MIRKFKKIYFEAINCIHARFLLLLAAVLVPILLIQIYIYHQRFETQERAEYQTNLEVARWLSDTFMQFIQNVHAQELAIGLSILSMDSRSEERIQTFLAENEKEFPALMGFAWITPEGRVQYSSPPEDAGLDISAHSFFREIRAGKNWNVSELFLPHESFEPVFTINRAIRNENGNLIGIVLASVRPNRLIDLFPADRHSGRALILVDNKGKGVFRHPRLDFGWEGYDLLPEYPQIEIALKGLEITGTVEKALDGLTRIYALVPIHEINWAAGSSMPEEEAYGPILRQISIHALTFFAVVLLGTLLSLLVARSIIRPLIRLQKHALALGERRMDTRLDPSGPKEFRDLSRTLNFMADELTRWMTDRKEIEDKLRSVSERLELALESAQLGTFDYRPDTGEVFLDERIKRLGASEPLDYDAAIQAVHPEDRPRVDREIRSALEPGASGYFKSEFRTVRPDDSVHWIIAKGRIYFEGEGPQRRAVRMTGIHLDITDRKQAEEALRKAHDELDFRVRERTTELETANREILKFAKKLEARNKDLDDFAFIASHHLQEPLRKIQTFSDRLRIENRNVLDRQSDENIRRVQISAKRMRQLIHDLLQYSRIGLEAEAFTRVDISQVVEEVILELDHIVRAAGASFAVENLSTIEADRKHMHLLFKHLLINALKFCGDRPPEIKITGQIDDEAGEKTMVILVEDNGIGFDEKYLSRIFTPFQRLHRHGEYEGTGMGLAICRKIVELHDGSITARSKVREGSTFILRLPV